MKIKNLLCLCIVLCLLLTGCAASPDLQDLPDVSQEAEQVEKSKTIPWGEESSIIRQAVDSNSLIVCFMSGEGMEISGGSSTSAFADTKWGDSALLTFPNGETMLIDGGMSDYAPLLLENLEALGVEKLDYLVVSHRHNDHLGGITCAHGVLESVEVGRIYSTGIYNAASSNPAKLDGMAIDLGIEHELLAKGDTVQFGDVTMEVLWPLPGMEKTTSSSTEDCNNGSLVLRFDYGETSVLFTGDIYKSAEVQLLRELGDETTKLQADVIKLPHHGRSTSGSADFIAEVGARVGVATGAIIMEPSQYSAYARTGMAVYMDVYDGYVKVVLDGENVVTQHSRVRSVEKYDKLDEAFGVVRD